MKLHRVTTTANILLPVLAVFAAFYVFVTAWETVNFALLQPHWWLQDEWVDPDAQIATTTRVVYLLMWLLPIALGLFGVAAAVRLLLLVRKGVLFDARVSRGLRLVGFGVGGSGLSDMIADLFTPLVLTWHNATETMAPRFYFDSESAGLIICGGGFYLVGWIMSEAIKLADENEGFI